jgi:hypothetical protein
MRWEEDGQGSNSTQPWGNRVFGIRVIKGFVYFAPAPHTGIYRGIGAYRFILFNVHFGKYENTSC